MSSNKSKIFSNFLSLGVIQIANFVIPLITYPIVARIIGPEKFGVIQYANAFVVYLTLFIGYGFNLSGTKRLIDHPEEKNKIFSEIFFCQLILLGISFIIGTILFFSIPMLRSEKLVTIFSFLFLISILFTQNWMFQAMQELSKVAVLNIMGKLIFVVTIILFIKHPENYVIYPLCLTLSQLIVSLVSFTWAYKRYKLKLISISLKECIEILKKDKDIFLSQIFSTSYVSINIILLGFMISKLQMGEYTAAQRLIMIGTQLLILPSTQILFPIIRKGFTESKELGIDLAQKIFALTFVFSLIVTLVIFFSADLVIQLFYGEKFIESVTILRIIAFVPFLACINQVIGVQFLFNLQKDHIYRKVMIFVFFLSLVLNLILTQFFESKGAAFSWLLSEIILFGLLIFSTRKLDLKIFKGEYFSVRYYKQLISVVANRNKK